MNKKGQYYGLGVIMAEWDYLIISTLLIPFAFLLGYLSFIVGLYEVPQSNSWPLKTWITLGVILALWGYSSFNLTKVWRERKK